MPVAGANQKLKIITLCGSTRFKKAYIEWHTRLTFEGAVVLSTLLWSKADEHALSQADLALLAGIQRERILQSDEIFVLDVGGYVGDATLAEIRWARDAGKTVRFLNREHPNWTEDMCRWAR